MDRKHQIFNFKGERINLKKKLLTYIVCDILSKNFLIEDIVVKRHMSS